ncbi:MAG: metal ABC transporter substrate-binding protein [Bacillota bacterium]|mgnify:CR=1 FL=1|nr:metal ABC transporter substrate-binding protein [Bacillota bacterium]
MKKKLIILASIMAVILIIVFFLASYNNKKNNESLEQAEESIRVVTSFYPTYVLTINLTDGIDDFRVDSLTDFSAGCLHDYQLTTDDMRLLSKADIFIINGGGMEEYLEDIIGNYPELTIVDLSDGISMLESDLHGGGPNPHVWLDPDLYMVQIENARQGLEKYLLDGQDKTSYTEDIITSLKSNASIYLDKVEEMATEMTDLLATVNEMAMNRDISNKVVVFHDSFAYIASKAGLEVAYTVEIDEDTPLSAGEVAEIIRAIREEDIRYLFTEQQYDDTITDRIKEETDASVYVIDSAVTGNADKDSYLDAMVENIKTLKNAFEHNK